jgi:hypothetical protein
MLAAGWRRREERAAAGSLGAVDASPPPPSLDPDPVVVHSSLRGLGAGIVTPLVLLLLGGAALADGGLRWFPATLVVAGGVLAIVAVGDLPRRTEFDHGGITRVCWLRREHVPWGGVLAIERTRPGTAARTRNLVDRREGREQIVSGGLVARGRGKRRWLLTDRVESRAEHDRLVALLASLEAPVTMRASAPHAAAPPTDLYRRRRHG